MDFTLCKSVLDSSPVFQKELFSQGSLLTGVEPGVHSELSVPVCLITDHEIKSRNEENLFK